MISKGYHYVISIGIASNLYISVNPVYPGSCARGSVVAGELTELGFFLLDRSLSPLSMINFGRASLEQNL